MYLQKSLFNPHKNSTNFIMFIIDKIYFLLKILLKFKRILKINAKFLTKIQLKNACLKFILWDLS